MTQKTLRNTTIIPKQLYVERAADRQLKAVIAEMGRPGYILVARQMGKTNLLINLKREHNSDIVLYLDLSNRFDTVRAWFRYVIDSLIESYSEDFLGASEAIYRQREQSNFEPNTEYDRHLRHLLRQTDKRFIIVLDEIDSLVNAPYSDVVLAQVRSMYFSRVNYPEYERLTYVLSGVAEPTDLIKDKNISPFNIGEKIYLDEFSRAEFALFIAKSSLQISVEVIDAVYSWASGNPRMTWDICSELEDRLLAGETPTPKTVDEVVEKLYLRDLDRAPIDHIRTLVENDAQIRDAIVSIRYGKSGFLDDKIRSKLYLSGITRLTSEGTIEIKNKIIDCALSDRWLKNLSTLGSPLLVIAAESFRRFKYIEALNQYERAIVEAGTAEGLPATAQLEYAICQFEVGNLRRCAELLENLSTSSSESGISSTIDYYRGLSLAGLKEYVDAIACLRRAIDTDSSPQQTLAKLHLMSVLISADVTTNALEVVTIGSSLTAELDVPGVKADRNRCEWLVSALVNKATALQTLSEYAEAEECLKRASALAPPTHRPAILLRQRDLPGRTHSRAELVCEAARTIIDNGLTLAPTNQDSLALDMRTFIQTLLGLQDDARYSELDALVQYAATALRDPQLTPLEALLTLFESAAEHHERAKYIVLLRARASDYLSESVAPITKLKLVRWITAYATPLEAEGWRKRYLDELANHSAAEILTSDDLALLVQILLVFKAQRRNKDALKIFNIANTVKDTEWVNGDLWFLVLQYNQLEFLSNDKAKLRKVATKVVQIADHFLANSPSSEEHTSVIRQVRTNAAEFLPKEPIRHNEATKFGRNDKVLVRYEADEPVYKKYKHVEEDLIAGRCSLVEQ